MKIYEYILDYEMFKKVALYKPYGKIATIGGLDKHVRDCINADLNPKPEESINFELYTKDIKTVRCLMYLGNWSADFEVYSPGMIHDEEYVQNAVSRILDDNATSIQELIDVEKYEAEKEFKSWKAERGVTTGY